MALLFNDERATKAVLSFLREAKVEQMITIPPRDRQEGEEMEEPREREGVERKRGGARAPHPRLLKGGAGGGGCLWDEVGDGVCLGWCVVSFFGFLVRRDAPL